jgi:TRL-like protein family
MLKSLKSLVALLLVVGGVALSAPAQAMGLLYTNTHYPLLATGATAKEGLAKLKVGQAKTINYLFLVEKGDASLERIVKEHEIKKIHFVDVQEQSVFIFFRKMTVTVFGE